MHTGEDLMLGSASQINFLRSQSLKIYILFAFRKHIKQTVITVKLKGVSDFKFNQNDWKRWKLYDFLLLFSNIFVFKF